ncbi:MAG: tRNA (adenosine(37)-N6)-threonylcarbamoyltransferase complex transferase subunit TsaD [Betaproteobacteria bacterium]|nr:tRNA (adenosine(37)-N6)-threonylcarbamoyltransferase complex transferase subunit TsaD [Betaproteobacteria bacterium]
MLCLGIESSCDETALALVRDGTLVDAILASQVDVHALFGGVVPELAAREHYRFMGFLYDQLMSRNDFTAAELDVVAVARGPGLLGSLLVGVAFAKALALASEARFVGVNHLHAHLLTVGLQEAIPWPCLGLLVSGGHTEIYLMESPMRFIRLGRGLDDAVGEAFDKIAKLLGLPYPGGVHLDALARRGRGDPKLFPRPYLDNNNLDFSFSGLKTAVATQIARDGHLLVNTASGDASQILCDLCASVNLTVTESLCTKVARALDRFPDIHSLVLAGGVAANSLLRTRVGQLLEERSGRLLLPPPHLCTDNGAMIAYAGELLARHGFDHDLNMEAIPKGIRMPDDLRHDERKSAADFSRQERMDPLDTRPL